LPVAIPSFEALSEARPRNVGLVFRCAACNEPRFVRATVRAFEDERVELAATLVEVERVRERFQFSYLPQKVERLMRETLECYTASCYDAFASMSRRTLNIALASGDGNERRRAQELVRDALLIGEVDAKTARTIESVLFGAQSEPPEIGADEAAVLIEVVKDFFYQNYVRTAKLKAAMQMRRFFAGESLRNVTPIERGRRGQ
jgi:hypothetical protein